MREVAVEHLKADAVIQVPGARMLRRTETRFSSLTSPDAALSWPGAGPLAGLSLVCLSLIWRFLEDLQTAGDAEHRARYV